MMIQKKMFKEIQDRTLFEYSLSCAMEYVQEIFDRNVFPTEMALQNLSKFEESLPILSGNTREIIAFLHKYGSPATVAQVAGRYFGFVDGGAVPAAIAVKYLTDFWDQNTPLYLTSPIISKLEEVVQKWLVEIFNLPSTSVAGFVSGTSMAIFCGLAAARWRLYQKLGFDINTEGLINAPKLRIIAGRHIHGAIVKAISLLGLGYNSIEWVDVNAQGQIIADSLPPLDSTSILILQAGNVNSGSFDDFEKICQIAKKTDTWVHIDGAFGLWAAASKRLQKLTNGIELANSWSVDGHKTLNTPYDSGIVFCVDEEALVSALHASGDYIIKSQNRDGMFYTPEMSRRARVAELWATLKYLGKEGLDQMITTLHDHAVLLAQKLSQIEGFSVLNVVAFNQILVKCDSDQMTKRVLSKIQEFRECWVGGSKWFGADVIRISICSWATTLADIERTAKTFEDSLKCSKYL